MKPRLVSLLGSLAVLTLTVADGRAEAAGASFSSDQVRLQLVAEAPDAEGLIRAALVVDLATGWKTYWRDPGEAGIPPTLDLSESRNLGPATIGFPAPQRFGDGYGMSNGYTGDMAVTLELSEKLPGESTEIRLKVMLGVCEKICVPVTAELSLPLPAETTASSIGKAFAALPQANDPATGILSARLSDDGRQLLVAVAVTPGEANGDIFVAGPRGWSFGVPQRSVATQDQAVFGVPVLSRPRHLPEGPLTVDAILTRGAQAVEARALAVAPPPSGSTPPP